jgi:FkbM family methyltransferase
MQGRPHPRTIIDVGANVSQMTRLLLLSLPEGAEVISFEPNESLKPRGKVFHFGLSDHDGEATFYLPADSTWGTFVPEKVKDLQDDNPKKIKLKLRRFDSLLKSGEIDEAGIKRPVLLKIDTEASELQVLRGFGAYLDRVDYVLMELTNPKSDTDESALFRVPEHLGRHGFNAGQILYAAHHGSALPDYLDVLFWKRN